MENHNEQTKWSQFISLVIVFFFWGFVAASNDILIPVFKKWFVLSQVQSQLVAWAFYMAYFIGSVIFFIISLKSDILQKFGYKKTLSVGLVISAIGAFLFIPAAAAASFGFFLSALFIVGLGFSVQQIVANPLAIKMGSPQTGAHRLTLAGGINSLGTTLGPILIGIALFGMGEKKEKTPEHFNKVQLVQNDYTDLKNELQKNILDLRKDNSDNKAEVDQTVELIDKHVQEIDKQLVQLETAKDSDLTKFEDNLKIIKQGDPKHKSPITVIGSSNINYPLNFVKENLKMVKAPFGILGVAFILVAIFMLFSKIEDPAKDEDEKIDEGSTRFNPFKYPQLVLGMLAIFIYVGVEVTIVSNLPALLHTKEFGGILEKNVAPFISLYWGSLMIGRWNGGLNVFNTSKATNLILKFVVPFIAFGIIIVANTLSGKDVTSFYIYPIWIVIFILMSILGGKNAGRSLMIFGIAGILMMICGLFYPDKTVASYFFISGGLFCSIMWPSIFDLAIAGLGKNTGKASSFLIMMILGGGVIPLFQGWICDFDISNGEGILGMTFTHFSYIIPVFCFLYLAFYGYVTPRILKKQGVVLNEESSSSGH